MALTLPKIDLGRKQILMIAGGVVVAAAAVWAGLQYFEDTPPPPAPKPVTPAKQAGAAKAAPAPSPDKLIADLLAASGLNQHIDQLPQQMTGGVKQSSAQNPKATPALLAAIEKAVTESFTAQGFRDRLNADLNKNFDQKRVQALLIDLSTPQAKRMIAMEQATPAPAELAAFVRSQSANRLPPQRKELLQRIDAATRASELALEAAFASMKAIATGIVGEREQDIRAVEKTMAKQRAAATANIRNSTFANLAYTYKDASDADLEGLAKLYETDNYKWFSAIVYASLLDEASTAAGRAGEQVGVMTRKAGKPGAPGATEAKPVRATAGGEGRSKSRADARACLELSSDTAIIKCAEKYR